MTSIQAITALFDAWDGQFTGAERLLVEIQPLFGTLQETQDFTPAERQALQELLPRYEKLRYFLQQEKARVQREASRLNQAAQKKRDYVKFNQSSGYEFYY